MANRSVAMEDLLLKSERGLVVSRDRVNERSRPLNQGPIVLKYMEEGMATGK
jgi:hypothetical protein